MKAERFIQPHDIKIGERRFVVSKIPAIDALPIHNIIAKAVVENGVLGITMLPPSIDLEILRYTAIRDDDDSTRSLDTEVAVNANFNGTLKDMKELVIEMVKENFGFLITGDLLGKFPLPQEAPAESAS